MDATAITYSTDGKRSHLRTVLVTDARRVVVLLPAGRLETVQAKLLHGQHCAHKFWAEALGLQGDEFAVPAEAVVQERTIANVKTSTRKH